MFLPRVASSEADLVARSSTDLSQHARILPLPPPPPQSFRGTLHCRGSSRSPRWRVLTSPSPTTFLPSLSTRLSLADSFFSFLFYHPAPGDAPGWKWAAAAEPGVYTAKAEGHSDEFAHEYKGSPVAPTDGKVFIDSIKQALKDVIAAEPLITRYDTIAGDGDCGTCLENGAIGESRPFALLVSSSALAVVSSLLSLPRYSESHRRGTHLRYRRYRCDSFSR